MSLGIFWRWLKFYSLVFMDHFVWIISDFFKTIGHNLFLGKHCRIIITDVFVVLDSPWVHRLSFSYPFSPPFLPTFVPLELLFDVFSYFSSIHFFLEIEEGPGIFNLTKYGKHKKAVQLSQYSEDFFPKSEYSSHSLVWLVLLL